MSDKITLGNLKARCRFPIVTLQQCHIHAKCGEHTEAEIICTVKGNETRAAIAGTAEDELEIASIELKESKHVLKRTQYIMRIRARIVPKIRKDSSDHYY